MSNPSAVLYAPHDLRVEDRPVPEPGPHEVLVHVRAIGICGSDVHYYEHGRIGKYVVEQPMVIGHESAGTIVAVGSAVDPARIGETVALEPGVPCRHCEQCLAGRYNLCPDVVFFATPPVDGSIASYVTIDEHFAHTAPEGLSFEQAAMAEPISVGVWAARKAHITAGDRVLITGAGPIGLYAAQVARAFGASHVTITDVSDFRLDAARTLGFDAQRADAPIHADYDVLLECSGAGPALTGGMKHLAPAARVVLIGMGADTVSIDVPLVQGKEISISGIFRYANTYPTALDLIASGAVDAAAIITHRFDIDHTEDALTIGRRDPHSLKAVVLPPHDTPEPTHATPILVIGEALIDAVTTASGEVREHPGGSPMNVAIGLGRLGDHVTLLTSLGADTGGDIVRAHLAASGVAVALPEVHAPATSVAHAHVGDDGAAEYTFDITWDLPSVTLPARIVHTGSLATALEPGRTVVQELIRHHRARALITFDPNIRPSLMADPEFHRPAIEEFFRLAHVVKLSDEDAAYLYPDEDLDAVAHRILHLGPTIVAITLGADGSRIYGPEGRITSPPPAVTVADTVGAGDSYMAGMIHILAKELARNPAAAAHPEELTWSATLLTPMIDFASVCSAMTVARHGADLPWEADVAQPSAQL